MNTATTPCGDVVVLQEADWRAKAEAHGRRVRPWVQPWLDRRASGASHPVDDFLFTYYSFRPSQLLRWHPGIGVACELGPPTDEDTTFSNGYHRTTRGVELDAHKFTARLRTARWISQLLRRTSARPATFGCFGLHEWAMVYRVPPGRVRHESWPLRLSQDEISATVESLGPRCTHFDAYRFFTESARPLNALPLTRTDQLASEQPGCLHVTMDLYKWSYKLSPMIPSDLVADCLELARDVRMVDMQASPYDLSGLDVSPIAIETPEGRLEYVARQREFVVRAEPLRQALAARVDHVVQVLTEVSDGPAS
jgi:hypothetical protein